MVGLWRELKKAKRHIPERKNTKIIWIIKYYYLYLACNNIKSYDFK